MLHEAHGVIPYSFSARCIVHRRLHIPAAIYRYAISFSSAAKSNSTAFDGTDFHADGHAFPIADSAATTASSIRARQIMHWPIY
jgi:hypothetical protein